MLYLVLLAGVAAGVSPVADLPYTEVVASRYTAQGAPAVNGWGQLPFAANPFRVVAAPADPPVAFVTTDDGTVWEAVMGVSRNASTPGMTSNNATRWTYPLAWSQVAKVSAPPATSRLAPVGADMLAVVGPSGVDVFKVGGGGATAVVDSHAAALGNVVDVAVSGSAASFRLWIASDSGFYMYTTGTTVQLLMGSFAAVAASTAQVAVGNSDKLWFFDGAEPQAAAPWWEWVTQVSTGSGGPIADNVTALAYDPHGVLYVGTPSALNVVYVNGSVSRVGALEGLPYANISSVTIQAGSDGSSTLIVGTAAGLASTMVASADGTPAPVASWSWSFRFLERWLPGPAVLNVAAPSPEYTLVVTGPQATPVRVGSSPLTGYGVGLLEAQQWTLAAKAERMEAIQSRHDRHGLVAECSLASFGDAFSCSNHCSDNNGLWTSLVVAAEVLRYNATRSPEAAAAAYRYYEGMKLLHNITGIHGLIGRSAIDPSETHQGGLWTPSTVPAYKGWTWKADASSDEVDGHALGLAMVSSFLGNVSAANGASAAEAAELLLQHADYIVSNGFFLIDFTGRPTTWGRWAPSYLNGNRSWSDERGVNANEILSLITAAIGAHDVTATPDADRLARLTEGWTTLTNATNRYLTNLLNLKIETPIDDNYSDDELTFLPYFTWLVAALNSNRPPAAAGSDAVLASLRRTWGWVAPFKSDLWSAITIAIAQKWPAVSDLVTDDTVEDMVTNLRQWPLELVEWPVMNSHRLDIVFAPGANRFSQTHTDSRRILPANERPQGRWNSNPHDLDGQSGTSEMDAGAWLLPYWLAVSTGTLA